jgi:zinc transporter ZupT
LSSSVQTSQTRVDALLKVLGFVCIIIGGVFAYFIYQTQLIPQLVPIFYFMAGLLVFVGAVIVIARFT